MKVPRDKQHTLLLVRMLEQQYLRLVTGMRDFIRGRDLTPCCSWLVGPTEWISSPRGNRI